MWHLINVVVLVLLMLPAPSYATSLRDPTMPPAGMVAVDANRKDADTPLVLNSIIQGPTGANAIINNQLYRAGERLQGTAIRHIGANEVVLADGRRLRLFEKITEPNKKR